MSDERPDFGKENLALTVRVTAIASAVCLAGAVVAYATGDVVTGRAGEWRTHMDACFVLGTLAVTLMLAALAVRQELVIRREPTLGRSHYE